MGARRAFVAYTLVRASACTAGLSFDNGVVGWSATQFTGMLLVPFSPETTAARRQQVGWLPGSMTVAEHAVA